MASIRREADRAGPVFAALADATRRRLLERLSDHPGATATELAGELPISRQAVLKQLLALRDAGLVESARDGRQVRFRPTPAPLAEAMAWMTSVGAEWDERLDALDAHLRR